jgi:hypothetical protein
MKEHTLLTKVAAGLGTAAVALALGACSHQPLTSDQNSGQIRTEAAVQQQPQHAAQVIGTTPAPANTQGSTAAPSTPAVISGPAVVDHSGNTYTSSSVGSAGNSSSTGLNTNVNNVPKPLPSTVVVTETPAPVVETTPAPVVVETPAPAPTPAPVVTETPVPMISSTTTTTTETTATTKPTQHRRLRKD